MSRIVSIPGPKGHPVHIRARDIVMLDLIDLGAGEWATKVFVCSGGESYTAWTAPLDNLDDARDLHDQIFRDWEDALRDEAYTIRKQFS